jgi:hypothetical protein
VPKHAVFGSMNLGPVRKFEFQTDRALAGRPSNWRGRNFAPGASSRPFGSSGELSARRARRVVPGNRYNRYESLTPPCWRSSCLRHWASLTDRFVAHPRVIKQSVPMSPMEWRFLAERRQDCRRAAASRQDSQCDPTVTLSRLARFALNGHGNATVKGFYL